MKWQLKSKTEDGAYNTRRKKNETTYTYESEDGSKVAFHSEPDQPFGYRLVKGSKKDFMDVTSAFTAAGFNQHNFAGGFDEAIKELKT